MTDLAISVSSVVFGAFTSGVVVMAMIDPTDIKEIIIAVGVFVAGVGVVVVNIINARAQSRKLNAQDEKLTEQGEKLDRTLAKAEVIEGHVNSEKTKAAGEIAALHKEVAWLREMVAEKRETASLLAQAAATTAAAIPSTPPKSGESSAPVLEKIEKHTKDTAVNTLKTEAVVEEIKQKQDNL